MPIAKPLFSAYRHTLPCNHGILSQLHISGLFCSDASPQPPTTHWQMSVDPKPHHEFDRQIRRVAVIGAGPAGTPLAKHLRDAGLEVRAFERQPQAGGVWNWREDIALPLSVPTPPPSRGAFTPVVRPEGEYSVSYEEAERFNPPNPCYWNLTNNVPTGTMAFKDFGYPPGTDSNISHQLIADYVHSYSRNYGLDKITSFNTRVESAIKQDGSWRLNLRQIVGGREKQWHEVGSAVGQWTPGLIKDVRRCSGSYRTL